MVYKNTVAPVFKKYFAMFSAKFKLPMKPRCSQYVLVVFRPNTRKAISTSPSLSAKESFEKLHVDESRDQFIAYRKYTPSFAAKDYGIIFCQGLMSNMNGLKAKFLENYCKEKSLKYVCFDYMGHGVSSGKFEDFTLSLWKENTLEIINNVAEGILLLYYTVLRGKNVLILLVAMLSSSYPEEIDAPLCKHFMFSVSLLKAAERFSWPRSKTTERGDPCFCD